MAEALSILAVLSSLLIGVLEWRNKKRTVSADSNAVDVATLRTLSDDVVKIKKDIIVFEANNRVLWSYVLELLDFIKDNKLNPPAPPSELESDPKIVKWRTRHDTAAK